MISKKVFVTVCLALCCVINAKAQENAMVTTFPKISFPHHLFISIDGDIAPAKIDDSRWGATIQWFWGNHGLGFSVSKGLWTFPDHSDGIKVLDSIAYTALMGLRLPLDFSTFYLIPYVNGGMGLIKAGGISDSYLMYQLGLHMGLHSDSPVNWLFGVSYKNMTRFECLPDERTAPIHYVDFSVAFVW